MRCGVHEAIARHDSIKATATNPVVDGPVVLLVVNEFDTGTTGQQKVFSSFADVAAVVEPVGVYIWRKLFLQFSST